ncbi:MAG: protein kinase [Planctomycetes bacterium]|nr:protein kinase [Planctomycetota bacterium]
MKFTCLQCGADSEESATCSRCATAPEPQRVGRYEIIDRAGVGGMGVVYRALDPDLNRVVALKVVAAGRLADETILHRFQREARATAKLSHPNIVPVYDVGRVPPFYYFAMEFVDGKPLDRLARDPNLDPHEAARIARDVARALHHAHQHGVIHRDIKPGNILVDAAGRPRIVDFGLAKESDEPEPLTKTGEVIGTAAYMPPEQAAGHMKSVDERGDVYALGAVLYEMLAHRPPFVGETMAQILRDVQERDPQPPGLVTPLVPRDLDTICLKALAKERDYRYQTAGELADDLDRFLNGQPILAHPASLRRRARRWIRRHPSLTTAMVMLALFLGAFVWTRWTASSPRLAEAEPYYFKAREEYSKAKRYRRPEERRRRVDVFTDALGEVDRALDLYPDFAEAYALRGSIRVELNQGRRALKDFDRAVRLKPTLADVYYERVVLRLNLLAQKLLRVPPFAMDDALDETMAREKPLIRSDIEALRRLEIRPDQALAAEARAAIFFGEPGRNPLRLLDEALIQNPVFADAYVLRARVKREEALATRRGGDRTRSEQLLREALDDCARAIEEDTNHREAFKVQAEIHLALGRRAPAMAALDEMVAIAPREAQSYLDRAAILLEGDRSWRTRRLILEDLDQALAMDPENLRARFLRGGLAVVEASSDVATCRDDFTAVLSKDPQFIAAHALRLACDLALGDETAFKTHFDALEKARPDLRGPSLDNWHAIVQSFSQRIRPRPASSESERLLEAARGPFEEAQPRLEALLMRLDDPEEMKREKLSSACQRALRIRAYYELACQYALKNDADPALAALDGALQNGYPQVDELAYDLDLENLKSRPEFMPLLERYRRQP